MLLTAAWLVSVGPVYHTYSVNEHFMMTCQGIHAVLVICPVVAGVGKADALNSAFALRFSSALAIQWPLHAFCCKMNSIFRQHSVITALLVSCSASNK